MVGLMAQGSRGLIFGAMIPLSCAFAVGLLNYLGLWTYIFGGIVGWAGPALVDAFGYEELTADAYLNVLMIPWILAPLVIGCAAVGMAFRLGIDAWADRGD